MSRGFFNIKNELIDYVRKYYNNVYSDFSDGSVGTMFIDLIAYTSNNIYNNLDRAVQEQDVNQATLLKSLYAIAEKKGVTLPRKSPSATLLDFTVTIPASGDAPDTSYMPIILRGAQAIGSGQVFETLYDIDFNNPLSSRGIANRIIEPQFDQNGTVKSYRITKREIAINGRSKYFIKNITTTDAIPFLKITLPDLDIIDVTDIITLNGLNINRIPSINELYDENNRWYQVDNLVQDELFTESNYSTGILGLRKGIWKKVDKRYVVNYSSKGFTEIMFGDGYIQAQSNLLSYVPDSNLLLQELEGIVNKNYLGKIPDPNTTMFIKYKIGGGLKTNLGVNVINALGDVNIFVNGTNPNLNTVVSQSLKVNNPVPSIGGKDDPTIEEIRSLIKKYDGKTFTATSKYSYEQLLNNIPQRFTQPFKYNINVDDNKIKIYLLTLNSSNQLVNTSSSVIKENIATYLSKYKSINDYVEIIDGKIVNLKMEIFVLTDPLIDKDSLTNNIIAKIKDKYSPYSLQMGDSIYVGEIIKMVNEVNGVYNINKVSLFNPVGGNYSINKISQPLINTDTREINLLDQNILFTDFDQIFEFKFNNDIIVKYSN